MYILIASISGFIMAWGLCVSEMINPKRVIGFLDVFGKFDPTLMFVMGGALLVATVGFKFIKYSTPLMCEAFDLPKKKAVDLPIIAGAAIFGIGWGLAGFCPGPAIVNMGSGSLPAMIFVSAMILGMVIAKRTIK